MAKVETHKQAAPPAEPVKSVEDMAAEWKARAEADVNPSETARQRLERLEKESKELIAAARKAARAEEKADTTSGIPAAFISAVQDVITGVEAASGKTVRHLSVRFVRPDDAPGVFVVKSRIVKPRSKA